MPQTRPCPHVALASIDLDGTYILLYTTLHCICGLLGIIELHFRCLNEAATLRLRRYCIKYTLTRFPFYIPIA